MGSEREETSKPEWADQPEEAYVAMEDEEWEDPAPPNTVPSGETLEADRKDALVHGSADDMPTPEEEEAAPPGPAPRSVVEAQQAAMERGANIKGEGQIE